MEFRILTQWGKEMEKKRKKKKSKGNFSQNGDKLILHISTNKKRKDFINLTKIKKGAYKASHNRERKEKKS